MSSELENPEAQLSKPKFYPLVPVVLTPSAEAKAVEPEPEQNLWLESANLASEALPGQSFQGDLDLAEPQPETFETSTDSMFDVSPALIESHTASIFIEELPESKNLSHVLETGEILTTGAIDISMFTSNTGEIAAQDAELVDASMAFDSIQGNVSSIAPLRATQVSYFGSDVSVLPSKLRRGEGQLYIALTVSIALVATGALVLAGYMLDLIK